MATRTYRVAFVVLMFLSSTASLRASGGGGGDATATPAETAAARRELPDELNLNLGEVKDVGSDVTVVLRKRSMRAETYAVGTWSSAGFKKLDPFPVSTYRGFVRGQPAIRVNANVEPGGIFNANFSEGSRITAGINERKIDLGSGKGTRPASAGNKVVPLRKTRATPTPGGYTIPAQPMRRVKFAVELNSAFMAEVGGDMEKAVSQIEQRLNDGDFVYARDIGIAWELALVVIHAETNATVSWQKILDANPGLSFNSHGYFGGNSCGSAMQGAHIFTKPPPPTPSWHHPFWIRGSNVREASVLLHEVGHQFYGSHHLDDGDVLHGCAAFIGPTDVQIFVGHCEKATEEDAPAVVYSDALPPFALADFANTMKDTPVTVDVMENDYDGNGDSIALLGAGPKSDKGGRAALSEDRTQVVYTPPPGFVGQDRFSYSIVDSTGVGNLTGQVKVDVRVDGLAALYSFEKAEKTETPGKRGPQVTYRFPGVGPCAGAATVESIEYRPVKGISGNGILNPVGGSRGAVVRIPDVGDPGRWSLSASLWVLFPATNALPGVIICKGGIPQALAIGGAANGWAIAHREDDKGFKFMGNVAANRPEGNFDLQSEDPIRTNTWYHLVMVMDREKKKLRAWVNNKEVLTTATTPTIPDGVIENYTTLQLFNSFVFKRWNSLPCLVDEVRIYTSVLTPEKVAELYGEGREAGVPDVPVNRSPETGVKSQPAGKDNE